MVRLRGILVLAKAYLTLTRKTRPLFSFGSLVHWCSINITGPGASKMVVYSFYIFDRHTECIYSKLWARDRPLSSGGTGGGTGTRPISGSSTNSNGLAPQELGPARARPARLSAQDDAKLIFGTIFSLRNMVRKLGGPDDSFISYRTSQYKLHYYETPTSIKFVMLTDTQTLNMRNVLHQIYVNLYVEYVVKNPLSTVEHPGGEGVANELFELALDSFVKGVLQS
ncbi:Sybindin-like family-domain-containing protein [Bisporella sp. PMI_857]|nr:Sybindin-like family-domain-containing protein [Bisporella sp. PMI_857]